MKLWDSLTTCLILLSAVRASSLLRRRESSGAAERPLESPPVETRLSAISPDTDPANPAQREDAQATGETYIMEDSLPHNFEDAMDFIKVTVSKIQRSPSSSVSSSTSSYTTSSIRENLSSRTRLKKEAKAKRPNNKGGRRGTRGEEKGRRNRGGGLGGQGQGCVLKQIHLNVSDLGLGYHSSEEILFRYCSGHCRNSDNNYDKILFHLVRNRNLPPKDTPVQACCRPIAFDDDLSFLDDSFVYHTLRKHSARKCGCV
ncbi:glial cell line-derived neurotrophic factor [Cololabis saira]|uniref:glial cell line-derived neurotrophic factor n=1 Tax=Cololabis saira TaxID=129043 RepID=UPI002AD3331C|nr:glial cell line-derived neurotrophic factor [Cololabis saira]